LNSPLVDRSNVSTRSKLHLQPMTTRLSYLLNPFLLATALTNEISSSLYINQFGSISTSFWRYPLKSVRRKALGWISYFTPSSSSVPPNVFSTSYFVSSTITASNPFPLVVLLMVHYSIFSCCCAILVFLLYRPHAQPRFFSVHLHLITDHLHKTSTEEQPS